MKNGKPKNFKYRWWRFRQRLARFSFKAVIMMLFFSGLSWLNGEDDTCHIFYILAKIFLLISVLTVISQSFQVNGMALESDFLEEEETE